MAEPITPRDRYLPKTYIMDIDLEREEGSTKGASVSLDRDFVLVRIQHVITKVGGGGVPTQDGAYKIDWSEMGTRRFWKGAPQAADTFGSVRHGIWKDLDAPIEFAEKVTLEATVINSITRPEPFTVQLLFVGVEPAEAR